MKLPHRRQAMGLVGVGLAGVLLFGGASPAFAARTVVPAKGAEAKVTKKVPGTVLSTVRITRDGFKAWAVKVKRSDGSIVVGFVDIASGIIFDWTVQAGPGDPVVDLDGPDKALEPAKPPAALPPASPDDPGAVPDPADDAPVAPAPTVPSPGASDPAAPPVVDDPDDEGADDDRDDSADEPGDDVADGDRGGGRGDGGDRGDGQGDHGNRGDGGNHGQETGRGPDHSDSRGRGR